MNRIEREKHTVGLMIRLYCRKNHRAKELCQECSDLLQYAHLRLDRCRYGKQKPACGQCKTHCYRKVEQDQVRKVMRFSGPRMVLYHPMASFKHALSKWRLLLKM